MRVEEIIIATRDSLAKFFCVLSETPIRIAGTIVFIGTPRFDVHGFYTCFEHFSNVNITLPA
jgi:hypothetical protein